MLSWVLLRIHYNFFYRDQALFTKAGLKLLLKRLAGYGARLPYKIKVSGKGILHQTHIEVRHPSHNRIVHHFVTSAPTSQSRGDDIMYTTNFERLAKDSFRQLKRRLRTRRPCK